MWKVSETDKKLKITSIPITLVIIVSGGLIMQFFILLFFVESIPNGTFWQSLGNNWVEKILSLVTFAIPTFFSMIAAILLPIVRTEINIEKRSVSVKKFPFRYEKKFGFDFIKNGIRTNFEISAGNQTQDLYFKLNSDEIVEICSDNSATKVKTIEIANKINKLLQM